MKSFAIGIVACGASIGMSSYYVQIRNRTKLSVAGVIYPLAIRFLIRAMGWERAMLCVAGIISATALLSFILAVPNPGHQIRVPADGRWLSKRVWVDTKAFRNPAYAWFVASVAILFFGFYAIFFNLEEVCSHYFTTRKYAEHC